MHNRHSTVTSPSIDGVQTSMIHTRFASWWKIVDEDRSVERERHWAGGHADLGMQVAQAYRGLGVGTVLVSAIVDWAHANRAHKVTLQVWPHNEAARSLYEHLGFLQEGRLRRHYRRNTGELWDTIVMGLVLDQTGPGSRFADDVLKGGPGMAPIATSTARRGPDRPKGHGPQPVEHEGLAFGNDERFAARVGNLDQAVCDDERRAGPVGSAAGEHHIGIDAGGSPREPGRQEAMDQVREGWLAARVRQHRRHDSVDARPKAGNSRGTRTR